MPNNNNDVEEILLILVINDTIQGMFLSRVVVRM